jgi:hypothetical protein
MLTIVVKNWRLFQKESYGYFYANIGVICAQIVIFSEKYLTLTSEAWKPDF